MSGDYTRLLLVATGRRTTRARAAMMPRAATCARIFTALVLLGCPLCVIKSSNRAYTAVDGVAALTFTKHSNPAEWMLTTLNALYYPHALVRECVRLARCAVSPSTCEGGASFVTPAFDYATVGGQIATTSRELTSAFGDQAFKEFCVGCVFALFGALKFTLNGDIGAFGMLSAVAVTYSTLSHEGVDANLPPLTWVATFFGLFSSGILGNARLKQD